MEKIGELLENLLNTREQFSDANTCSGQGQDMRS